MNLEDCLPADLRAPATTITRIQAGLSGAGVYRVEAAGQAFVLKVSGQSEPLADWRGKVRLRQLAASAHLAPAVIHVDEERRAVLSAFVVDRSFPALYFTPATRDAAIVLLGRTLRRVHDLPLPPDVGVKDPKEMLATIWSGPLAQVAVPGFVGEAVQRVLTEDAPASERAAVLSHNDVNPTNLVYDGEGLVLLDWETAGRNDPFYDLAAIAVFLRMDDATCRHLLSAHDGAPVAALPVRFTYDRRVVAVLCGAAFLHLARQGGHAGALAAESADSVLTLGEVYQQLRAGSLRVDSPEGQWAFGLALVKESFTS